MTTPTTPHLLRLLASVWVASVLLAAPSYAATSPTAASPIPPIPAQQARIWFYRDLGLYENRATPYVRLNGAVAGVSQPGGAFYVDVPPGHYHISADSFLDAPNQDQNVDLGAGQEIFAKVLPMDPWIEGGGGGRGGGGGGAYRRDTFVVWLFPAEAARPQIAQSWFYGGGTLTAALPPR